jgi:hypothetical protein
VLLVFRLMIALCAFLAFGALLVVGAANALLSSPSLRQFGAEPTANPSYVTTLDSVTLQRLQAGNPAPQVKKLALSGADINLSRPIQLMGGGPGIAGLWPTYLRGLRDGRLATHPAPIEVVEVESNNELELLCAYPKGTRYPELKYPLRCPEKLQDTPQDEVLALPNGFTSALQQFAVAHTEREGWALASIIAALKYADHLRYEMRLVGVMWPENVKVNEGFDYCVAGISLRAVFPADVIDVSPDTLVSGFDTFIAAPDDRVNSYRMFALGFQTGRLDQCVSAA